ncbi:hypothetical protein J4405_02525 [Candidatus Woesearchaeota archaeon]|nr:hypothetical protein [Candidatus Woesearchaeota archaeon]
MRYFKYDAMDRGLEEDDQKDFDPTSSPNLDPVQRNHALRESINPSASLSEFVVKILERRSYHPVENLVLVVQDQVGRDFMTNQPIYCQGVEFRRD